MCAIMKTRVWQ